MPLKEQWILLTSAPIYILVILVEIILSNIQLKKFYSAKETIVNVYLTVLNASVDVLFRIIYVGILLWFYEHRIIETWNSALLYWIAIFIAEDFYTIGNIDSIIKYDYSGLYMLHITLQRSLI